MSFWRRSTDSKTLDYQRTNPREYQIVRTHCKESTSIQDLAPPNHQWHPVQDASSKQQTNKQNTNPIISRQDYHLTQPCPSEEKQTKTQHKSHSIGSLHKPLGQTSEGRNQKEERIQSSSRKEFNFP